jgi:SAM-dependent methyltransferase
MGMSFYDEIAKSYSKKRKNPWKAFELFIKSLETKDSFKYCNNRGIWCDLGAGNGRNLSILTKYSRKYVGTDLSFPLLEIAREENDPKKQHNWVACDVKHLPFRKHTFQSIVSVAVFHHILSKQDLRVVLSKIKVTLCKEGILILTLWGVYGGKNRNQVLRKNFHRRFSNQRIMDGCTPSEQYELAVNDILVPWTKTIKGEGAIKKPRIYHLYTYNELGIFAEFFEIIMKESKDLGENAGTNYFLYLLKK